jgi:hypothetical protein
MAKVGTVFDAKPARRTSGDIMPANDIERAQVRPGPVTSNKWLTASIVADAASVVGGGSNGTRSGWVTSCMSPRPATTSRSVLRDVRRRTPHRRGRDAVHGAYAVTGNLGLPAAFVVVGVVLGIFAVGYVAMGRHLPHAGACRTPAPAARRRPPHAGAMYAYAAHGLGRWVGVGVAWMALLAYNLIQVSLSGAIGAAASPLVKDVVGVELPWWVYALAMWALVAVLGIARVDLNGRIVATLLVAEVTLLVVYDLAYVTHPAVHTTAGMAWSTWSPAGLARPGVGAILAIAVLGFVGFESAVVFRSAPATANPTITSRPITV